jgi:CRP-like cAMP-binding protein
MAVRRAAAKQNLLLAMLPADDLSSLLPMLTAVDFPLRLQLHPQDDAIKFVYFPTSGMVSLVANLIDGTQAEVGIVGREGMVGSSLLCGIDTPFVESMVQMAGAGLQMNVSDFRGLLESNTPFRSQILRYYEALLAQIMQTAACNGRHGLEQRLARWLLMAHDRTEGDTLHLTQEFIAMMLGVHRPSITITAGILQRAGLIKYAAGQITVLDRPSLEAACCECYDMVKSRHFALLGTTL